MPTYKADLHIHTLLSPCGDLDMTPEYIVETALRMGSISLELRITIPHGIVN